MLIEPITPIDSQLKGLMIMSMTTNELAETLETTPRTLRKFLRSKGQGVGKGSRYALPSNKREVTKMTRDFAAWDEARKATPEPAEDATDATETD